ncbi:hypothetical protein IE53DRAFT_366669 [Violaceomyces palustris]|uniref:Uncharacterized protein n=1 Tax=Violaceomyces palustris TaxID=1673888 RepID=A0ACD0P4V1_9BASI|nr:hypothetical protein IE53DRAFT_366669 [Violaceomyces palustris]
MASYHQLPNGEEEINLDKDTHTRRPPPTSTTRHTSTNRGRIQNAFDRAVDSFDRAAPNWLRKRATPINALVAFGGLLILTLVVGYMVLLGKPDSAISKSKFGQAVGLGPGDYLNAAKTDQVPLETDPFVNDVVLITKVGSATLFERLMTHVALRSASGSVAPKSLFFSDAESRVGEIHIQDILANVSDRIKKDREFSQLYSITHDLLDNHQRLDQVLDKETGWKLDKFKFLPMMGEAYRKYPDAKWYVMVEADTFLFWNQLVKWLKAQDHEEQLYFGHPSFTDHEGKSFMFSHGGSGFVLSKGIMDATYGLDPEFEHHQDDLVLHSAFGDALLSLAIFNTTTVKIDKLSEQGWEKFNDVPPRQLKFRKDVWCNQLFTFHHVTPNDIYDLYDFQTRIEARLKKNDFLRWADVWEEFKPQYLKKTVMPGKEVLKRGWQVMWDWDSETDDSYTSDAVRCQEKCRENEDCYMWEWKEDGGSGRKRSENSLRSRSDRGNCRWTSQFLRIGVINPDNERIFSGWMGDRIERWAKVNQCAGREGFTWEPSSE